MKNSPTEPTAPVAAALAKHADLVADIESTVKLNELSAAEQANLEANCSLLDDAALTRIARLQTITTLSPRRIAAKETALVAADTAIVKAVSDFLAGTLNPRARALQQRAREQARAAMRPHFLDDAALEKAVEDSDLVRRIGDLSPSITAAPVYGALRYAEIALDAWRELNKLESAFS